MTHIEIIETFKTKLSPSKIIDSLEKIASFYDDSGNGPGENDLQEDLENNPYSTSASGSVKIYGAARIA